MADANASVSRVKGMEKSGVDKTGACVIMVFSVWKARSAVGDHLKLSLRRRVVSGEATVA